MRVNFFRKLNTNFGQHGITFVSSLIGIGILGISVAAVSSIVSYAWSSFALVKFQADVEDEMTAFRKQMQVGSACKLNFAPMPLPPIGGAVAFNQFLVSDEATQTLTAVPFMRVGPFENKFQVQSMNVVNINQLAPRIFLLRVDVAFAQPTPQNPFAVLRSSSLTVEVNATNNIIDCKRPESTLPTCDAQTKVVPGFGTVVLPAANLTEAQTLNNDCECVCRVGGWVCRCLTIPPGTSGGPGGPSGSEGPPGPPGAGGGGGGRRPPVGGDGDGN